MPSKTIKKKTKKTSGSKKSCWKNYKRVGMKKKGYRMVPNCVPKNKSKK